MEIAYQRTKQIRRVTWVGLGVNLFLAALKLAAGTLGFSQALIADAVHSLSDSITDVAILLGSRYWDKPPDDCHPYGHGRIETLVTLFIGAVLVVAGVGITHSALTTIQAGRQLPVPGVIAVAAAALSIVVKELLYRWTARAGRQLKSNALSANAWHHRVDAVSSVPAMAAVGGAILFPHFSYLDPVGAVVVAVLIFHAALKIILPGLREFVEAGASAETLDEIAGLAASVPGVRQIHGLRTRQVAGSLQVDLHVVVDGDLTVREGHTIAEAVKEHLLAEGPDVLDVVVHMEPPEAELPPLASTPDNPYAGQQPQSG
jgi:cation diffusion facilitator family transporter